MEYFLKVIWKLETFQRLFFKRHEKIPKALNRFKVLSVALYYKYKEMSKGPNRKYYKRTRHRIYYTEKQRRIILLQMDK